MGKKFFVLMMSLFIFWSAASADMVARRNGTVSDLTTGLTWQQAEGGAMTWAEALVYCQNLRLANQNDWRLPNCVELQSIVDYSKRDPSINTAVFPGAMSAGYWSSTPYTLHSDVVWVVDFVDGTVSYGLKSYRLYVRAVRGGQ
jgi:hypothetical protein